MARPDRLPSLWNHPSGAAARALWGRRVVILVLAVLLVVGVALLVGKAAGYGTVVDSLRQAAPAWLSICFGGEVVAYAGYVVAFRGVARFRGGPVFGVRTAVEVVFGSLGATRLLAAGGAGGLAFDYWALRKAGQTRHEAVVRVLALNTLLYAIFGLVAAGAAAWLALSSSGISPAMTVPWLVAVPACAGAAVVLSSRVRETAGVPHEVGRLRRAFSQAVAGVVLVRALVEDRTSRVSPLAGATFYWVGDVACLWGGLRAFGVEASAPEIVLAYATGYVATLLPLPTGVGGVDAAMTFALTAVGVPLAPALLGVVAYRLFSFWLPTLPAIALIPSLRRLEHDLEAASPDS